MNLIVCQQCLLFSLSEGPSPKEFPGYFASFRDEPFHLPSSESGRARSPRPPPNGHLSMFQ